ncbi:3'-to-5' exoribonuclease RNase R [Vibrio ishigakensis]|uniref:3'-to-5' exoribonuclease RNase R n=1 Tax=Vibrio ishigakensis TaxID=1481914 RepID=A0A0B8QGL1_9VIBR|nr:3'-to-5' exoribonuclease RNase R [Vibrio ishigakensis]
MIGKDKDLVLPFHQMRGIIHGDYVLVQESGTDKRGRKEARIVRVLEERSMQIVGRFFLEFGHAYVVLMTRVSITISLSLRRIEQAHAWVMWWLLKSQTVAHALVA